MRSVIDYPGATVTLELDDTDRSWAPYAAALRLRGCSACNHPWATHQRAGCGVEVDRSKKCGCARRKGKTNG
jgi:hypothetical protein